MGLHGSCGSSKSCAILSCLGGPLFNAYTRRLGCPSYHILCLKLQMDTMFGDNGEDKKGRSVAGTLTGIAGGSVYGTEGMSRNKNA